MATPEKALEKMREICLALPGTHEGPHFGQSGFYVKGKLFATCGEKRGVCEISFGLEADHAAALAAADPMFRLHPRDKRGVVLDVAKVKDWSPIQSLLVESYELLKPSKPPKKKPGGAPKVSAPAKRKAAGSRPAR